MRVRLHLFSGRPNPTWPLRGQQAAELLERVTAGGLPVSPAEPPKLGFRGFTVEADIEDVARRPGLPAQFVVPAPAAAVVAKPAPAAGTRRTKAARAAPQEPAADELTRWLLGTAESVVDDKVLETAAAAIRESSAAVRSAAEEGIQPRARKSVAQASVAKASLEGALPAGAANPI